MFLASWSHFWTYSNQASFSKLISCLWINNDHFGIILANMIFCTPYHTSRVCLAPYNICSQHAEPKCWTFSNPALISDHSAAYDWIMTNVRFHWLILYLILHSQRVYQWHVDSNNIPTYIQLRWSQASTLNHPLQDTGIYQPHSKGSQSLCRITWVYYHILFVIGMKSYHIHLPVGFSHDIFI